MLNIQCCNHLFSMFHLYQQELGYLVYALWHFKTISGKRRALLRVTEAL